MNFSRVASGIDVSGLISDINRQPELWNKNPCRLSSFGPHRDSSDIFIRYKDERENIESGEWSNFCEPHIPVWYQSSDLLPDAKRISLELLHQLNGEMLGGVFIYKLEPGKRIYPHIDTGWHAAYFRKFNVCLQSNESSSFNYEDEKLFQSAGDVHEFRNDVMHSVVNDGDKDHLILIVCIRLDRGRRASWSPDGWTMDGRLKCQQVG